MTKLRAMNELTEEVKVPQEVAAAVFTSRPELLRLVPPHEASIEECKGLYHLIGVLIQTNHELQVHSRELAEKLVRVEGALRGLQKSVNEARAFAKFEEGEESDDE